MNFESLELPESTDSGRRAVIFAGGELGEPDYAEAFAGRADLLIAANGGLAHAMSLRMPPHIVVGDLDSVPSGLLQLAQARGAEIIRHPARKDMTDLELALHVATARGAREIAVLGALGGRIDHALANVILLSAFTSIEIPVRAIDESFELFTVRNEAEITGRPGDVVTLLALSDTVSGITTTGLEYPLTNESLSRGSTRGVSNVMVAGRAAVAVGSGDLLVVHVKRDGV